METFALDQVYDQGIWAGSRTHLIDPFDLGRYTVKVYDDATGTLIFSKGFDSYFGEYKTSDPGVKGVLRTYHESALLPYPKKPVRFTVEARDRQNVCEAGLQPDDRPGGRDRHPRAAHPRGQGRRGAQVRRAPPQGGRGHHRRGLHRGGGGEVRGRPRPLRRRLLQARALQIPQGPVQYLGRLQALGRKRLRRAEPRLVQGDRPSARPSIRSAPSATS